MLKFTFLFVLMLAQQSNEFDFGGQIVSAAKEPFRWVQVESIDHHFVEYCKLDVYGRCFPTTR